MGISNPEINPYKSASTNFQSNDQVEYGSEISNQQAYTVLESFLSPHLQFDESLVYRGEGVEVNGRFPNITSFMQFIQKELMT
jgi:hypothetical protein